MPIAPSLLCVLLAAGASQPPHVEADNTGRLKVTLQDRELEFTADDGIARAAEAIGTCGPIEPLSDDGVQVRCDGLMLSWSGREFSVHPLDGAPKRICRAYLAPSPRVDHWTLKPNLPLCWGDKLLTDRSTLDEVKKAMSTAYEVVPDPEGQRLRSSSLHWIFNHHRLVRVESVRNRPPAVEAPETSPTPTATSAKEDNETKAFFAFVELQRRDACAAKRAESCRRLTAFMDGSLPPISQLLTLGYAVNVKDGQRANVPTLLIIDAHGHARESTVKAENGFERLELDQAFRDLAMGKPISLKAASHLNQASAANHFESALISSQGGSASYALNVPLGGRWLRRNGGFLYLIYIGGSLEGPSLIIVEFPDVR